MFEELDDFFELLFCFVCACDVFERHFDFVIAVELRAALAERHHARAAALRLLHHEEPDTDEKQNGKDRR